MVVSYHPLLPLAEYFMFQLMLEKKNGVVAICDHPKV